MSRRPQTARATRTKPRTSIPPLKNLLFEQCGFTVPAGFTSDFVELHDDDWTQAERDWEQIVVLVLDTDAVSRYASGGEAVKQAVEAASAFLKDDEAWPWCPVCKRGTAVEKWGETDGS